MVKITRYDKDGNIVEEKLIDTRYNADDLYKPITAQRGDYSKKWGRIPFKNWRNARNNNGGL